MKGIKEGAQSKKSTNRTILYLIDDKSNANKSSRNAKKLGVSTTSNIGVEQERSNTAMAKNAHRMIDLRPSGVPSNRGGRKYTKSNSRGNAFKYKQSSNKKDKGREFRSQTRLEMPTKHNGSKHDQGRYPAHAKIELYKSEDCPGDQEGSSK